GAAAAARLSPGRRRLRPFRRRSRRRRADADRPPAPDDGAHRLSAGPGHLGRLGQHQRDLGRAAGDGAFDAVPVPAEREAGAARMPDPGGARPGDDGADRDGAGRPRLGAPGPVGPALRRRRRAARRTGMSDGTPGEPDTKRGHRIDPKLLEILECPVTHTTLRYDAEAQELISDAARLAY